LGLLVELIGATLLAGSNFVTPQEDIFTLSVTRPLRDLALTDVVQEPRLKFLGILGTFSLIIGFTLQYCGTLTILSLPWWIFSLLIAIAAILGLGVIYYLAGQDPDQVRKDKFRVLSRNIKRNIITKIKYFHNELLCDYCNGPVTNYTGEIWWMQEPNSDRYPFLHEPYKWHIGHPICLQRSGWYTIHRPDNNTMPQINLRNVKFDKFIQEQVLELEEWWTKHRQHWSTACGRDNGITSAQEDFQRLKHRLYTTKWK
jgi:hypothetical protein